MKRQKTTKSDASKWALTPKQRATLDLLAVGTSITEAAEATGVSRQTVSEWLHHHHGFQAALNRRRRELWTNVSDRLRALLPKALTVLEREIEDGSAPLAAAVHVLKACAVYGSPLPIGSTDPAELDLVEREHVEHAAEREITGRERAADRQLRDLLAP